MPSSHSCDDTSGLVRKAQAGSSEAVERLFDRHRSRLRRMVVARMDDRLSGRIDPSDVVQETLAEAYRSFDAFLRQQPNPFFPWIRRIAANRLIDLHRRHVMAERRTVTRELPASLSLSSDSIRGLARLAGGRDTDPNEQLLREELRHSVQRALLQLSAEDYELLILRQVEGCSVQEVAELLQIPSGTVKSRHYRALRRLQQLLSAFLD
jgi:RNA polymerase sigma-70 factor (ECF subfamily)